MDLNTRGRYAVMAMADLAKHQSEATVPLSDIAERQHLSLAYLEQLFLRLRRHGLVESVRGRCGGYRLAKPAADVSVGDVMAAVEERTRMTRCLDGPVGCLGEARCLTHGLWAALGQHISTFVHSVSLQDILDGLPEQQRAEDEAATQRAVAS